MPRRGSSAEQSQVAVVEPAFDRTVKERGPDGKRLSHPVARRLVVSWTTDATDQEGNHGEGAVRTLDQATVDPSQLPHISMEQAQKMINPDDDYVPSWETANHTKATRPFVDTEKKFEEAGGTGDMVLLNENSFGSRQEWVRATLNRYRKGKSKSHKRAKLFRR